MVSVAVFLLSTALTKQMRSQYLGRVVCHRWRSTTVLIFALLGSLVGSTLGAAGVCPDLSAPPVKINSLDDLTVANLPAGCIQRFVVTQDAVAGTDCADTQATSFLHVELWDLNALNTPLGTDDSNRADALLVVAKGVAPNATFSQQNDWQFSPPTNSFRDIEGYRLLRNYQHVQVLAQGPSNSDAREWYITLTNVVVYMEADLDYHIRVTCSPSYQCPAPSVDAARQPLPACSSRGMCAERVEPELCTPSNMPCAQCACDVGWGDVGCDVPMQVLRNGVSLRGSLGVGLWSYFQLRLNSSATTLLVEMNRTRGDPVLFAKRIDTGFQPGGVPSVIDYEDDADQQSFRARVDNHHISIPNPSPATYYVAIYNNDVYLKENASITLMARWNNTVLCPRDCSGNGVCAPGLGGDPVCKCSPGWGGDTCSGPQAALDWRQAVKGRLVPGDWAYYNLSLRGGDQSWRNGITIDFSNDGGHAVLIAKKDDVPTLLNNDFIFRSKQKVLGKQEFKVKGTDLSTGTLILGVFNMDYYTHDPYNYVLQVSQGSGGINVPPYLSIVLGVTVSLFVCIFLSLFRRFVRRHGLPWRPREVTVNRSANAPPVTRGVERSHVETFPTFKWAAPSPEVSDVESPAMRADSSHSAATSEDSYANPSCSVCLQDYQENEMMRRLPPCGHEFHQSCIDAWLTQHTTCPICRCSLLPGSVAGGEDGVARTGSQVQPESPRQQGGEVAMTILPSEPRDVAETAPLRPAASPGSGPSDASSSDCPRPVPLV